MPLLGIVFEFYSTCQFRPLQGNRSAQCLLYFPTNISLNARELTHHICPGPEKALDTAGSHWGTLHKSTAYIK